MYDETLKYRYWIDFDPDEESYSTNDNLDLRQLVATVLELFIEDGQVSGPMIGDDGELYCTVDAAYNLANALPRGYIIIDEYKNILSKEPPIFRVLSPLLL